MTRPKMISMKKNKLSKFWEIKMSKAFGHKNLNHKLKQRERLWELRLSEKIRERSKNSQQEIEIDWYLMKSN